MSDVRALLKAKRQEARISHRYASYNANGQLRCLACGTVIKHASAWEGHLGSKVHRSSVAQKREEEEAKSRSIAGLAGSQRTLDKHHVDADDIPAKRRRLDQEMNAPSPPTVVSEPSRILAEEGIGDVESEYRQFQLEVLAVSDADEKYEGATVVAEPELFVDPDPLSGSPEAPTSREKKLDDDQRRVEEREMILDRLLDEERAQEDADMRVNLMKKRLEAIKTKRRK
ncbi:hypothetical protein M378DRAFT_101854 [Amanita muscaria Koide BX008]|uniref:Uncharacterized protein n=1 Tax=Amanita muscaria (strain Koide BX008) TaxID=946122 RepID=A0A0C2XDC4_AMAMK|nr:hypothetical protein M378DRAFT_101854 [Amanita muscaria Koide BX008]